MAGGDLAFLAGGPESLSRMEASVRAAQWFLALFLSNVAFSAIVAAAFMAAALLNGTSPFAIFRFGVAAALLSAVAAALVLAPLIYFTKGNVPECKIGLKCNGLFM